MAKVRMTTQGAAQSQEYKILEESESEAEWLSG
jgi:hypothetical protein